MWLFDTLAAVAVLLADRLLARAVSVDACPAAEEFDVGAPRAHRASHGVVTDRTVIFLPTERHLQAAPSEPTRLAHVNGPLHSRPNVPGTCSISPSVPSSPTQVAWHRSPCRNVPALQRWQCSPCSPARWSQIWQSAMAVLPSLAHLQP